MRGHRAYLDIKGPLPKGTFYVPKALPNVAREAAYRGPILPMLPDQKPFLSRIMGLVGRGR